MKKLLTMALIALSLMAKAQESKPTPKTPIGGRPNIPNDLNIEFGFNQLTNRPEDISLGFIGSRSFHVYYQVPIKIFGEKSGFTINPGIGIGAEKFQFKNDKNLFQNPKLGPESSELKEVNKVYGAKINLGKNNFAANYIEMPIDLQYHFNKNNYNKSFRVSLGAKVGYLYDAHTKISYDSDAAGAVKIKSSENYGLEKLRYGLSFKAGSPGFYVWSNFYLNDLWQVNRGPFSTEASQISFGLAVSVF
jgi:hypothetical protein